jgi:hypothetical protein
MRAFATACLVAVAVTACSDGNDAAKLLAAMPPPAAAPERSAMPGKCKDSLRFDQECSELFDKAFGKGVGSAERVRLINDRAYSGGNAYKPSTAKPAPELGP